MFKLPTGTLLGVLQMERTIEHYDFPRIFVCRNTTQQRYLVLSTYDDEERCEWLYLPISEVRLNAVLTGHWSLRQAFVEAEGRFLFIAKTFSDAASEVSAVFPEQIEEDDLPAPDYYLSEVPSEVEENIVNAQEVAFAARRETFNYRIFPGDHNKHEIAARKLGGILTTTQELLDSLGQAVDGSPTLRGPLPIELLQKTRVQVAHVFRSSFGVQFRADQHNDLLDDSKVSDALGEFCNLLQAVDSEDLLSNKLHVLKGRVASKYRRLLKELSDINSGIVLEWGSVHANRGGSFRLSREEVANAYKIVDRIEILQAEEITVVGQLIGYNSRTRRYEIRAIDGDLHYAGKAAPDAEMPALPPINEFYVARLRSLIETQSTSGDELIRWVLVGLVEKSKND
ncbi:MAG: DUF6575 domain-containing protein [Telluria sp.]